MIAHLSGTLLEKQVPRLVVDVGGVGYEVLVPLSTFYAVGDRGERVALGVYTRVTDEAIQLYGFHTALERTLFERLIGVNGVGPKLALAVLSGIEPAELVRAVRHGDVARLTRTPGIGRKTAERLVLELKDRLPAAVDEAADAPRRAGGDEVRDDILSALVNLGYQRHAVEKTVDTVIGRSEARAFEPLLRETLRELAR
ncbi:MAG: Holliday junction branch migration protein RuvA [Acidobacteria bacterium]|nr:Holliday junction branch migration protein RuvA [Acidobacteriota bacterium]